MFACVAKRPATALRTVARANLRPSPKYHSGLPFRIRVPLEKLKEVKNLAAATDAVQPSLGDGEQLETGKTHPDYMRLALTSRVYDFVDESPLQPASNLSSRLGASIFFKREDLLPSFSYRIRGVYNLLGELKREGVTSVVSYSVGGQGHSLAVAARVLGMHATVVMPERTPLPRRHSVQNAGGTVIIHGANLGEAEEEARRLGEASDGPHFCRLHDDVRVISGHATTGLEIVRQFAPLAAGGRGAPDAIFVCTGGGSLLAGIAAVVKQLTPGTKVIGVEPEDNQLMLSSLNSGHRPVFPTPSHFVDGAAVRQIGSEVFRVCNELVDDIVTVTNDEICAAVRDSFEDTRAMLEPAGAVSVAGVKRWLEQRPHKIAGGSYVCISSDASNIEFDVLRFIAERASLGERKERLFALTLPDEAGAFFKMYKAVQPRWVTEFIYRHKPDTEALVYMSLERANDHLEPEEESRAVVDALAQVGVGAMDITGDEMAKTHAKFLGGGRPGCISGERLIRFEFPEQPGSLANFLSSIRDEWFLTLLHYRNHGGQIGKVLAGVRVPAGQEEAFDHVLESLGYTFHDETENPVYKRFMT